MLRVLLAGEDAQLLARWSDALMADERWWVPEPVTSVQACKAALARRRPDLVVAGLGLLDASLVDMLQLLRRSTAQPQEGRQAAPAPVLVVSPQGDLPQLIDALLAGADSILACDDPHCGQLPARLAELHDGGAQITPWMAHHVLAHFGVCTLERPRTQVEDLSNPLALTAAEVQLLQQLAGGQSLTDLARERAQPPRQLAERLRGVWRKLQWSRRAGSLALV